MGCSYDEEAGGMVNEDGGPSAAKGGVQDGVGGASHFKGVSWHKWNSKWRATMRIDGKQN